MALLTVYSHLPEIVLVPIFWTGFLLVVWATFSNTTTVFKCGE